jgi:hypothetical protein
MVTSVQFPALLFTRGNESKVRLLGKSLRSLNQQRDTELIDTILFIRYIRIITISISNLIKRASGKQHVQITYSQSISASASIQCILCQFLLMFLQLSNARFNSSFGYKMHDSDFVKLSISMHFELISIF